MLVMVFPLRQSISKACCDIKHPQLSKTTYRPVLAEYVRVCVHLGCNRVTEAGIPAEFSLPGGFK